LTRDQGVIIPDANVEHLMLSKEVRDAVAAGHFRVYSVKNVDECMALLTGMEAGERDAQGQFPEGSVNQRVVDRLEGMADIRIALAKSSESTEDEDDED